MIDVGPAGDGHAVLRKDQPLRTPGGAALVVPTAALAGEIAREQKGTEATQARTASAADEAGLHGA